MVRVGLIMSDQETNKREVRFVEPGTLPGAELLALFDHTKNLLIVDRKLFSSLSENDQERVLNTQSPNITIKWSDQGRKLVYAPPIVRRKN